MKIFKVFLIFMTAILALIISNIIADFFIGYLSSYQISPKVINPSISQNEMDDHRFFLQITISSYFLLSLTLPLILSFIKSKVQSVKMANIVLAIELLGVTFSYLLTPPDILSTLIIFILWQPIVLTNSLVLIQNRKKL
jgi:hypothetical protein